MSKALEISEWEVAYTRFQTPQQERAKFLRRLRLLRVQQWDRQLRVLELFCGRGSALEAWGALGFRHVEGLDLSADLLSQYKGPARTHAGDARALPFPDGSRDVIAVQGGLHHLRLMQDLLQVLREIHRVLAPGGRLVLVEPWRTPFLGAVHAVCGIAPLRRLSGRLDALARMIELEKPTYEDWLDRGPEILEAIREMVEPATLRIGWGKLMLIGTRRPRP